MLEREIALRLESQAAILRLRALHIGLETMAHDTREPLTHRVLSLLEALVPRFANHIACLLPGQSDAAIATGTSSAHQQVLQTVVIGPAKQRGRLIARRNGPFLAEDGAILQSAANGISLSLFSKHTSVLRPVN